MELTLFHKNNTKELYNKVDKILIKSGFSAELGFIPDEKKREATLLSLANMNKGNHFSICGVKDIFKLNGIKMSSEREDFFSTMHCVGWGDMGEDMRAFINALIFKELEQKNKRMKNLLIEFEKYINEWNELERQYLAIPKIPIYHFIKQMNILNKKEKLTNDYNKFLNKHKEAQNERKKNKCFN